MKKLSFLSLLFVPFLTQAFFDFTDQSKFPSWSIDAIETVKIKGIMKGFGDGTFRPYQNITRAEVATLLLRSNQRSFDKRFQGQMPFPDVPKGAWFYDSTGVAYREGWIKGRPDGKFYPADNLTKAEFVTLIARVFGLKAKGKISEMPFQDIAKAQWYSDSVLALYKENLLRNARNRYFRPSKFVTRAEAAWTFAQIAKRPGLNGKINIQESNEIVYNARRVAIKPRNFNANKQGYKTERNAFYVEVNPVKETPILKKTSDWVSVGNIRIKNKFDSTAQLNHLDLRLRFDKSNMGPAKSFKAKISIKGVEKIKDFQSNGEAFFPDVRNLLLKDDEIIISVSVKTQDEAGFYPRLAKGLISVDSIGGEVFKRFVKSNSSRSKDTRNALIQYNSRNLAKFEFNPVVTPEGTE